MTDTMAKMMLKVKFGTPKPVPFREYQEYVNQVMDIDLEARFVGNCEVSEYDGERYTNDEEVHDHCLQKPPKSSKNQAENAKPSQFSRVFLEVPASLRRDKGILQALIESCRDSKPWNLTVPGFFHTRLFLRAPTGFDGFSVEFRRCLPYNDGVLIHTSRHHLRRPPAPPPERFVFCGS